MVCDDSLHKALKEHAQDRGKGDWPVVLGVGGIPSLRNRRYLSNFQVSYLA